MTQKLIIQRDEFVEIYTNGLLSNSGNRSWSVVNLQIEHKETSYMSS